MNLNELYEKTQSLISLELFNNDQMLESLEKEFSGVLLTLNNMTNDLFRSYDTQTQFEILRIYDVYFRSGVPLLEDNEYDGYDKIYKEVSEDDTPIMFEPSVSAWEKENHLIPMGSLSKCSTLEEVEKWNSKPEVSDVEKVISEKLDGISLEVLYEKGKFVKAITRGDGKEGDVITENAVYFDGMVKELGECMDCAVRGEVVITKENFHTINTILIADGKDPMKNTRNGVSGQATKFKGRNEEILSLITFIAYEIQVFKIHETGENVV